MISIISGVISNLLARLILKSLRLLKLGAPYVDLEFVPTALGLEETPVRLPQLGNGNLTIRGRVHELKQGMELPFFLPNGTTGLVILGWGVLIGPERFHGSLVDFGKIGELRFYGRDDKHVNTIDISLPHGAKPLDLKLADANPIMSGKPSETLVGQAGFLARVEVRQNPTAREFWDHVNVWISEVEVPSGAQRAVFNAINGSMNIVHLRALRRPRLLRVIEKFRRESVAEAIPDDPNVWAKEAELLRHSVSSFEKIADAARDEGTCMEAVSSYVNAAWGNVKLAYFPGRESSKAAHLQSSALQFECAADAAKQVGENLLAAKYYVHALLAVEQAGSRREDSLVEKATAAPMELESQQRDREPLNMDMLYRVCEVDPKIRTGG